MEKIYKKFKKNISLIIHCAAQPSHDYGKNFPILDFNVNGAGTLNLLELTEKTCKWPIGDPATSEFWFCGHPSEQGKPYCETHISIAFQPITTRREKKQTKILE